MGYTGAAYVFARNAGGGDNWGEVAKLQASDASSNDTLCALRLAAAFSGSHSKVGAVIRVEEEYHYRLTCRVRKVGRTAGITCEAHIDDDRDVVEHLQFHRFDWFMPLFGRSPIAATWDPPSSS